MYRCNSSDEKLRKLERQLAAEGPNLDTYCQYVAELRRSHGPLEDALVGEAQGSLPAIVHLLAPLRNNDFPRAWREEQPLSTNYPSFDLWYADIKEVEENRKQLAEQCMPARGILSTLLEVIQSFTRFLNVARCNCGGDSRGHSPDCEVYASSTATEAYEALDIWMGERSSQDGLLDEFCGESGWPTSEFERVYDVFSDLSGSETPLENIASWINRRTSGSTPGWTRPLIRISMDWPEWEGWLVPGNHQFKFRLEVAGRATNLPNWFEFALSENSCHIKWDASHPPLAETSTRTWAAARLPQLRANFSRDMAQAIANIPQLLREYPVWR